jgi:hypothetical protein
MGLPPSGRGGHCNELRYVTHTHTTQCFGLDSSFACLTARPLRSVQRETQRPEAANITAVLYHSDNSLNLIGNIIFISFTFDINFALVSRRAGGNTALSPW